MQSSHLSAFQLDLRIFATVDGRYVDPLNIQSDPDTRVIVRREIRVPQYAARQNSVFITREPYSDTAAKTGPKGCHSLLRNGKIQSGALLERNDGCALEGQGASARLVGEH